MQPRPMATFVVILDLEFTMLASLLIDFELGYICVDFSG
jgi:hypothetical protein